MTESEHFKTNLVFHNSDPLNFPILSTRAVAAGITDGIAQYSGFGELNFYKTI